MEGPYHFASFDPFALFVPRRSRIGRRGPRGGVPPETDLFARRGRSGRSVAFVVPFDAFDPFVITDRFAFFAFFALFDHFG
jgi:hypothetical protein